MKVSARCTVIDVTVAVRAVKEGVEAIRGLNSLVRTRRQNAADVREAKRLLGLAHPSGEAYRSDAVHPLYAPGEIHPDNQAALMAAGTDVLAREAVTRDMLKVDATDSSLLLFGSPTSEGLSRVIFDYAEIPGRDGLLWKNPPLDFAYAWDLDPEAVGPGQVGRFVPGKGVVERPPWQIKSLRKSGPDRYVPEVDSENLIAEDYLLITRIRNFLSPAAEARGQFLVSFGGAHGTGTRAVALLFRDKQLMRKVLETLKTRHLEASGQIAGIPKAYQLLFRVYDIRHGTSGSVPGGLELVDAVVLRDDDAAWSHARRQVSPRLIQLRSSSQGGKSA